MITIKYVLIPEELEYSILQRYTPFVSEERQNTIEKLRFDKDKSCSLLAELLVRAAIMQNCGLKNNEIHFLKDENGKPYLKNVTEFPFYYSISHTAGCVVLAYGQSPLGVDVEKIEKARMAIAKRYFTLEEQNYINLHANQDAAFFEIWTKKEAYIKKTGEGLSKALDSFCVLDKKIYRSYRINHWEKGPYQISVCSDSLPDQVEKKEISWQELMTYFTGEKYISSQKKSEDVL